MPQMCPMNWFTMSFNLSFFYMFLFMILYYYFQNFKKIEKKNFKMKKIIKYKMIW